MATIQIPVLFDMSGDTVVFGEEVTGDFVSSHLDFLLDMTTQANDISLNASDISSAILIGDIDNGDNIFFSGGTTANIAVDNLCNRIAKAVTRGKFVHIPKSGNTSNSGIPIGGRFNLIDENGVQNIVPYTLGDIYTYKYNTSVSPIGDEQMLGQAMARIASIHLVGSPLAAGIFTNQNQIQTDLETASTQTFNSGGTAFYNALAVQLSKVLGGSKSTTPMTLGTSITSNPPLTATLVSTTAQQDFNHKTKLTTDGTYVYYISGDDAATASMPLCRIKISDGVESTIGTLPSHHDKSIQYHDGYIYYRERISQTLSSIGRSNIATGAATSQWATLPSNVGTLYDRGGMTIDSSGNLWYISSAKLLKITLDANKTVTTLISGLNVTEHLLYNNEGAIIYAPSKGMLYVVGKDNKLVTVDPVSGAVSHTLSGGFVGPNDMVSGIYNSAALDSGGEYIYFASVKGLGSNDNNERKIQAVKLSDYSLSTHFTHSADITAGLTGFGGKLYFGTQWGALPTGGEKLYSINDIGTNTIVNFPIDASGVANPALKSIFEQLMNVPHRSQIMTTRDASGVGENLNYAPGGFPFIAGDKLVMYLRPKIVFAAQTFAEQTTTLTGFGFPNEPKMQVPVYDIGRKSSAGGAISGQTYTESSAYSTDFKFDKCFEGAYNDTANHWYSGDNQFHDVAPFDHDGGYTTTNVDGSTTLSGSWGQVDIGQNTYINKYILWASGFTTRRPDEYSLLGSLNGTNWTTIKYVTEILGDGVSSPIVTVILSSAQGPYRYYRLSIKSVNGNGKQLAMNGLLLYGAKESEVIIGQPHADYITDISGLVTNVAAIATNIETAFPGNATTGPEPEINKWGWMGSANSDSLSLETTDIQDVRTCDLHIWKVTITL